MPIELARCSATHPYPSPQGGGARVVMFTRPSKGSVPLEVLLCYSAAQRQFLAFAVAVDGEAPDAFAAVFDARDGGFQVLRRADGGAVDFADDVAGLEADAAGDGAR